MPQCIESLELCLYDIIEVQPIRAQPRQTSANESGALCLQLRGASSSGSSGGLQQAGQAEEEEKLEHDLTEALTLLLD